MKLPVEVTLPVRKRAIRLAIRTCPTVPKIAGAYCPGSRDRRREELAQIVRKMS